MTTDAMASPSVPPSQLPLPLLATKRGQGFAFCAVAVLGALLLVSPALFFVAVVAGLVSSSWFCTAPIDVGLNLSRYSPFLARYSTWLLLLVTTAWMGFSSSLPVDDLLRHIQSSGWRFNYVPHYAHHILPTTWSWTVAFDAGVGAIHRLTGDVLETARIVRAIETAFVGATLLMAINRATKNDALRFFGFSLALIGMVWGRLQLGRPEILFTGLVFAACFMHRSYWLALFAFLAPAYAFSPVYAAACLLLGKPSEPLSIRIAKNVAVGALASTLSIAFWLWYTSGEYVKVYSLLNTVLQVQSTKKIWVGELLPIVAVMSAPISIFILAGFFFLTWRQMMSIGARPAARIQILLLLAVAFYFCLPNYVRYTPIIWSLFIIAALYAAGDSLPQGAPPSWIWVGTILFVALNITPRGDPVPPEVLKAMRAPPGSRILAPFNRSSYIAIAANPDAVVTPIFDISAVTEPARDVVLQLTDGKFSCAAAESIGFDYLIENTLNGQPPTCLTLVSTQGNQRLWRFNDALAPTR